jgi:hypothetical protein
MGRTKNVRPRESPSTSGSDENAPEGESHEEVFHAAPRGINCLNYFLNFFLIQYYI